MPLEERRRFYDFTLLSTVISSVPGQPLPQVLMFEVILDGAYIAMFDEGDHRGTDPCRRSFPLLRRVIEGTCMILVGVRTDDVAEEPQTPEHDRLCDRRLSRSQADFLVDDMSSERDS